MIVYKLPKVIYNVAETGIIQNMNLLKVAFLVFYKKYIRFSLKTSDFTFYYTLAELSIEEELRDVLNTFGEDIKEAAKSNNSDQEKC